MTLNLVNRAKYLGLPLKLVFTRYINKTMGKMGGGILIEIVS